MTYDDDDDDSDYPLGDEDEGDTIDCPHCGRQMHEDAELCPHCGMYVTEEGPPARWWPWWMWIGLGGALFAVWRWVMG